MGWGQRQLRATLAFCLGAAAASSAVAQTWTLTGPTGGDVRALAVSPGQPHVVYLGTAEAVLYRSDDAGRSWRRLEPGLRLSGMSIDNIAVTPAGDVLAGYWQLAGGGGGVARSSDGGRSFKVFGDVAGESVRALTIAASDPARIVAGTLTGVFASSDGGGSWRRISPSGHPEIRNVESVAIDPRDPRVIYAGTWHLAWKTLDGGKRWLPISTGMFADSDVFTLTLDARSPGTVFATACTGIYRSRNGGALWMKLHGIPSSSRRTRAFAQDPDRPETLYAGTTEGLWASDDAGVSWSLRTEKELVVNALVTLPGGVLLLGTDGAGILRSEDRGRSFERSNDGFSARLIAQLIQDRANNRWIAAVRNDRFHSGVLTAPLLEGPWTRLAKGLEGREASSLALSGPNVYAGTDDGVFVHRAGASAWRRLTTSVGAAEQHPRVDDMAVLGPETLLLATDRGLLRSADGGQSFDVVATGSARSASQVLPLESGALLAATPLGLYRSDDRGRSFRQLGSGPDAGILRLLALPGDDQTIFATTASGLHKSVDGGRGFYRCYGGLPVSEITGLAAHPDGRTLYAADFLRGGLFQSDDRGETWRAIATDGLLPDRVWSILVNPERPERLLAATASGGLHAFASRSGAAAASH